MRDSGDSRESGAEVIPLRSPFKVIVVTLFALWLVPSALATVPFWGAKQSSPVGVAPKDLAQGEFVWNPAASAAGPITVLVSLDEQLAYVYRNGVEIGYATISSGKPGYETPTGVFTILQKDKDHRSSTYNNAPMPYTERLTWGGVALHAGGLPGYPSSHGCVHLPSKFAEELFEVSPMGMTVVVADGKSYPGEITHPTALAPIDAKSGAEAVPERLHPDETFRWQPELAREGPVSLVVSRADRRIIVLRNGVEIGRSRIEIRDEDRPFGQHVFAMKHDPDADPSGKPTWIAISLPGREDEGGKPLTPDAMHRVQIPPAFVRNVQAVLGPGVTLFVTDEPVAAETTGPKLTVLGGGNPEGPIRGSAQ